MDVEGSWCQVSPYMLRLVCWAEKQEVNRQDSPFNTDLSKSEAHDQLPLSDMKKHLRDDRLTVEAGEWLRFDWMIIRNHMSSLLQHMVFGDEPGSEIKFGFYLKCNSSAGSEPGMN